jgi:hypothetical protein
MNQLDNPPRFPYYTRSTLPPAASVPDQMIVIVESTGARGMWFSDGLAFYPIASLQPAIVDVSAARGYVLADLDASNKAYWRHPAADTTARTWTIPANATIALPVGTHLIGYNENAAGVLTLAITTDTMYLEGAGTTGIRTIAANGRFTATKIAPTIWMCGGTGVT